MTAVGIARVPRAIGTTGESDARATALRTTAVMLIIAAALHIGVGVGHLGSNFATLALLAGGAQAILATTLQRGGRATVQASVALNVVLVQLFLINALVGLPPSIAHSHIGGTHELWVFTLAWPGTVEWNGALCVAAEVASIASGILAIRHTSK